MPETAVAILAGGRATRLPGKLHERIGGVPMLLRVYRAMRATHLPVYVAAAGSLGTELDAALDCPLLLDRWPSRGPLGALLSVCGAIAAERVFAVAGDTPHVEASVVNALADAWQSGDRAVVPEHGERIEPLAALYDRRAVLDEGFALLRAGNAAMHALVDRLQARRVPLPAAYFLNVNTPDDLRLARGSAP